VGIGSADDTAEPDTDAMILDGMDKIADDGTEDDAGSIISDVPDDCDTAELGV
jgi:hypothetical protein